jgi:hypothetical protein
LLKEENKLLKDYNKLLKKVKKWVCFVMFFLWDHEIWNRKKLPPWGGIKGGDEILK